MTRVMRARSASPASVAAWGLLATSAALMAVGRWADVRSGRLAGAEILEEAFVGAAFLGFPAMGALIASRRPRNPIGWLLAWIGVGAALLVAASAYTHHALVRHNDPGALATSAAWVEAWLWYPLLLSIGTFLFLLFPDGRLPSRRWRWVAWSSGAVAVGISAGAMVQTRLRGEGYSIDNPIGIAPMRDAEEQLGFLLIAAAALIALSLASLVVRYRRGNREERQQLKWVAMAAAIFFTTAFMADVLEGRVHVPEILFPITMSALPISIAIAVLKYRLYDLERVINRALVYTVLTLMLAFLYLGLVVALQRILTPLAQESDVAVAASTLAVAALFGPLRRRLQNFIDRRFYRSRYDAQKTLEAFSTQLRDEVDLDHLTSALVRVVTTTMRPQHASLWLRPTHGVGR